MQILCVSVFDSIFKSQINQVLQSQLWMETSVYGKYVNQVTLEDRFLLWLTPNSHLLHIIFTFLYILYTCYDTGVIPKQHFTHCFSLPQRHQGNIWQVIPIVLQASEPIC